MICIKCGGFNDASWRYYKDLFNREWLVRYCPCCGYQEKKTTLDAEVFRAGRKGGNRADIEQLKAFIKALIKGEDEPEA